MTRDESIEWSNLLGVEHTRLRWMSWSDEYYHQELSSSTSKIQ